MTRALVVGDLILDTLVLPKGQTRLDTDNQASITTKLGGSAANFATWLASVNAETHLLARVGKGDAKSLTAQLLERQVIAHLQEDRALPTGRIMVLVEGENRTFYTDRGANQNLQTGVIPADAL